MPGRVAISLSGRAPKSPPRDDETRHAPTHIVPHERIVSIEHPCIVKNFDNGVKSMGGEPQIKHALEHKVGDSLVNLEKPMEEPQLGVSLRPQDAFAKKLSSVGVQTRNVLIKVTLPRRTGRKRKRGSDDPFAYDEDAEYRHKESLTAPELLRSLQDNAETYQVEAIGTIGETHRFRNLPDFQIKANDNKTMRDLARHAYTPTYESVKSLHIDMTPGSAHIGPLCAPPFFIGQAQPYTYAYQQAAGVALTTDPKTGAISTANFQNPPRRIVHAVAADAATIPIGPPADLTKHSPFGSFVESCVVDLSAMLEDRPIMTKRVAVNALPNYSESVFKEATQWVSYNFSSGPWRDTLIKYGVDPRSDPKYRVYQTLMFQLDRKAGQANAGSGSNAARWNRSVKYLSASTESHLSHLFTGQHVTNNGKTWQITDITDPLLASIFATEKISEVCDPHTNGWYHNGTIAKARAIMRDKMEFLFAGLEPPEGEYEAIAAMPEVIGEEDRPDYFVSAEKGARIVRMAGQVRQLARLHIKSAKAREGDERALRVLRGQGDDEGNGDPDGNLEGEVAVGAEMQGDGIEDLGEDHGQMGEGHALREVGEENESII